MDEKIDKAIEDLITQAFRPGSAVKSEDAVRFSQAALNLAHVKTQLASLEKPRKQGAGA